MGTSFTAGEIITLQGEVFDRLIALLKEKHYDEKIQELRERLHTLQAQEKIRVAFVGQYSAGKSSIVSALTGQEVAIGTDVTTEVSTDYEWGSFLLTDTPGLQNNQTHDAIAAEAIKNSDLIVYCITYELFNRNTLCDYLTLAYDMGYKSKMILVINKINSEETDNRDELIANYIESLNKTLAPHSLSDVPYCFIDVLDYIKGREKYKEKRIIRSNFLQFIDILNEYLSTNGLLCKMDTPLRVASAIIDSVMIDESETDEERQKKIIITRLDREFQILRAEASRKWNGEVNRELADFSEAAYALFERIQSGECEHPEEEFDKILATALESINGTLTEFSQQYDEECNEKAGEILNSSIARRLFGDINVEATEEQKHSIGGGRPNTPKKGNEAVKAGVTEIGQKLAEQGAKVSQEGAKKVILNIGHKLGHKFKPWGATKLASKATKALKCLGPALEVFSFAMDVKDTIAEDKAAKEQQKARNDLYQTLEDTKREIRKACELQRAEFVHSVFESRIDELAKILEAMAESSGQNHDFNLQLNQVSSEIKRIQDMIMSSAHDSNPEVEDESGS